MSASSSTSGIATPRTTTSFQCSTFGGERRERVQTHAEHRARSARWHASAPRSMRSVSPIRTDSSASLMAYSISCGGPPGVHRHRDRADREDGGEGDDPLRVVAHGDAHAVPGLDAVVVHQRVAQGVGLFHHLGEGPLLVLVDDERLVEPPRGVEELTQVDGAFLKVRLVTPSRSTVMTSNGLPGRTDHGVGLLKAQSHRTLLALTNTKQRGRENRRFDDIATAMARR